MLQKCFQDGRFEVAIPKPPFQQLKEKMDDGGIRSPKYPSTVTKVTSDITLHHSSCFDDVTGTCESRRWSKPGRCAGDCRRNENGGKSVRGVPIKEYPNIQIWTTSRGGLGHASYHMLLTQQSLWPQTLYGEEQACCHFSFSTQTLTPVLKWE